MLRFQGREMTKQEVMGIQLPAIKDDKGNTLYEGCKLEDLIPQGKDKSVTFQWLNLRPYQVMGAKGMVTPPNNKGGEKSKHTFNTVVIPSWKRDDETSRREGDEGVMQYYESSVKRPSRDGNTETLSPDRVYFMKGQIRVDAEKNWSKFAYLILHSENIRSSTWSMKKPMFRLVEMKDGRVKATKAVSLYIKAIQAIDELEKNPSAFKQFYEANGYSDYDLFVKKGTVNYEALKAPLYERAKANPQQTLSMIKDESLNIMAKVTVALDKSVLHYENGAFAWGDGSTQKGKPVIERVIARVPKGKQDLESAKAWFIDYLKGETETMTDLNIELGEKEKEK